ncbi:FAD-binding oxidoreductase [Pelagibius litoralis]|uniref:FAD-binding oxidoreductase n=1 Tax=Pelagibius litoralis TaxID=374515 RepID=A0A967EXN2_9PROT|nr:FAD-binding oxidoreductase [Pelagibius litoralis]NIA69295.1 FAD-binding oxidoreductase [Pelagibius litoralis]
MNDVPTDRNLWRSTAGDLLEAPPLNDRVQADVVIVGGGFTGCSAALHLAEAGMTVRLLEAKTVGFGGSGRNAGLVNAGLWLEPEKVEAALGPALGGQLNEALAAGPDLVFSLIDRLGIDCEAVRNGTLHCAHSAAAVAGLRERLRQFKAQGAPVELLSAAETASRTGTSAFHGALLDRRAGSIQPLAYCRGLARAALSRGAVVHEETPALQVTREKDRWSVETPGGSVTAPALLVAVNAYGSPVAGVPAPAYAPLHYFQLASRPLSDNLRKSILPERQGCWDTATVMSSFRLDAAGRLLIGAVGSLESVGGAVHRAWAARKLAALFPALAGIGLEHAWFGRIAVTGDHMPKVVRLGERGVSVFGYSGRGIAPGTVFGKAVADYFAGGDETVLPGGLLPDYRESLAGAKQAYYELGAALTHAVGNR